MFERLIRGLGFGDAGPGGALKAGELQVVVSMPDGIKPTMHEKAPGIGETRPVFEEILLSARRIVRVFSPFVDSTFSALVQGVKVPIQVVTTEVEGKHGPHNAVLRRLSDLRNLAVKYLKHKDGHAHLYQLHAKVILADEARAYIGSANMNDTSVNYNIELGLVTEDPAVTSTIAKVFDYVFWQLAWELKKK
jgi:phosphatidylserine/phosphatidylglycerophosphate/cardiolipin synthase-like enzyme